MAISLNGMPVAGSTRRPVFSKMTSLFETFDPVGNVGFLQGHNILRRQLDGQGGNRVCQMIGLRRADDRRRHRAFLQDPGRGDLGAGDAMLVGQLAHRCR